MTMQFVLNGEKRELPQAVSVAQLIRDLGRDPRTVAVELNGRILRRDGFEATQLRDGDRVEVVHFVQGG